VRRQPDREARATRWASSTGISFLRTTRADTPSSTAPTRSSPSAGARRCATGDDVAIVAAGITLHEALEAAETLEAEDISARVIDVYSVKPIDAETLRSLQMPIVTVEDHWPEGGLGEAVLSRSRTSRTRRA
jgi:transketolase